ncbi:MAG: sigma-70 family RNA polymerase sigma factor [Myxococcota bacterium]
MPMVGDDILVERARAGDELAFAAIVERYKDRVVRYLARMTGDSCRAEDLAQDAFIRFFERLDRYDERGKLAAFLLRTATRVFLSEERRLRRRALLSVLFSAPTEASEQPIIDNTYQREVRSAVAELPVMFRAPLVLHAIEGLSYDEIGQVLGVRTGTVKSRIARARAQLKDRLEPPTQEETHERLVAR